MKLTELEQRVLVFIQENADEEFMDCVDMQDLSSGLRTSPNVLRGVLSSLSKKDLIEIEEFHGNHTGQYYWPAT